MKTSLKCHCGQSVSRRDVMQRGFYMRHYGPSFVYIKFRCSRCKKLGEQFVKQEEWEENALSEISAEFTPVEASRFQELGAITLEEMNAFHHSLDSLNSLSQVAETEGEAQ